MKLTINNGVDNDNDVAVSPPRRTNKRCRENGIVTDGRNVVADLELIQLILLPPIHQIRTTTKKAAESMKTVMLAPLLMMLVSLPSLHAILLLVGTRISVVRVLTTMRRLLLVLATTFLLLSFQTTMSFLLPLLPTDASICCRSTNSRHRLFEIKFFRYSR